MTKALSYLIKYRFVIGLTLLACFIFLFRLHETQLFINDTARDTLRALKIWQDKEITLVGASASFSEKTVKEIYFGSLYLYAAIAGMLVTRFSPIGAILPNTLLYTISVPIFFLLSSRFSKKKYFSIFSAILYALTPITVTHARFFWNPNLLIPLSVFFWYLALTPIDSKKFIRNLFLSGIIVGIMFNLHYFSIIPILFFGLYLLFTKKIDHIIYLFSGFLIGSLPLIVFEFKNDFYLTNAFVYNLGHGVKGLSHTPIYYLDNLGRILLSIFGLSHGEIPFPVLQLPTVILLVVEIIFIILFIKHLLKKEAKNSLWLYLCLVPTIALTLYFSTYDLYLRYLFSAFPLLILFVSDILISKTHPRLAFILFIPIIFSNFKSVSTTISLKDGYLSLDTIEAISNKIVSDNPQGKYNITESIRGDARSTAFRFYLLRDAKIKPQSEISYGDLNTLYVVSPSIETTYKEGRWELAASGPKDIKETTDFGEVKLFRLERIEK